MVPPRTPHVPNHRAGSLPQRRKEEGREKGREAEAPQHIIRGFLAGQQNDRRERKNERIGFDLDADAVSRIDSVMWCTVLFVRLF